MATKKKSNRWLKILGGIIGVLVIGAVVAARMGVFSGGKKGVLVEIGEVKAKTITQMVSASGKISPEVEVKISSDVSGEIVALPVKEGDAVKKGDLLARIRPDIIEAQLEQLTAALNGEKARRDQVKANIRRAEANLKQQEDLFKKNLVSELAYISAQSELDGLKATLKANDYSIANAEAAVAQKEKELQRTVIEAPIDGTVSKLNVELGERVVGSIQMAGTEIMRVARMEQMEVEVDVNENDIVNVTVGDSARVKVDAYPNRNVNGKVMEIANSALISGAGTTEQVTNYRIKIRITSQHNSIFSLEGSVSRVPGRSEKDELVPELLLKPGMSASVDIMTETVENVVAVPIQAVTVRDFAKDKKPKGSKKDTTSVAVADSLEAETAVIKEDLRKVVFVVRNDSAFRREVVTGISDDTHLQVLTGLEAGDKIVTGSYRVLSKELEDRTLVRTDNKKGKKNEVKAGS